MRVRLDRSLEQADLDGGRFELVADALLLFGILRRPLYSARLHLGFNLALLKLRWYSLFQLELELALFARLKHLF